MNGEKGFGSIAAGRRKCSQKYATGGRRAGESTGESGGPSIFVWAVVGKIGGKIVPLPPNSLNTSRPEACRKRVSGGYSLHLHPMDSKTLQSIKQRYGIVGNLSLIHI